MTTNIYQVFSPECTVPLTLFAEDPDDAALTYKEWVSIHMPLWSAVPDQVEAMSDQWLAERPQLAAARERVVVGGNWVLYFLNHVDGWEALPTYADPTGQIAPFEPSVQYFVAESDDDIGGDAELFAHSLADAIQLYIDWYEEAFGRCKHAYTIVPQSRWLLVGEKALLRAEMDLGCTGVAGRTLQDGWHIFPFDHQMAGE
jgi:hypothetical protein